MQTIYIPFCDILQQPALWQDSILGAICFTETPTNVKNFAFPNMQLNARILNSSDGNCELWLSHANLAAPLKHNKLENGCKGAIQYRLNEEWLFGSISLPETTSLQHTTESAYRQIFALMDELKYPHAYRFWNYMADINGCNPAIAGGLERYRQFNIGRRNAFLAYGGKMDDQLPAACALGLVDGPLNIAFLLGRTKPIAVENPRQVSAYNYPEEYGPQAPSFSRATLLHAEQDTLLFISGTASIVGHQTQHKADVVAQTRETLANLDALIAEVNYQLGTQNFNLQNMFFRVYVRHAADLPLIRDAIKKHLGDSIKIMFIQADICRQELLLEIEASAGQTAFVHQIQEKI